MSDLVSARQSGTARATLWIAIAFGLLLVLGANAHLVYVAERSQPSCLAHAWQGKGGSDRNTFSAAQSACSSPGGVAQSQK